VSGGVNGGDCGFGSFGVAESTGSGLSDGQFDSVGRVEVAGCVRNACGRVHPACVIATNTGMTAMPDHQAVARRVWVDDPTPDGSIEYLPTPEASPGQASTSMRADTRLC
jgi:hypothetical protein